VYDWDMDGGHDFIGECTTTLEELAEGEGFQILQVPCVYCTLGTKRVLNFRYSTCTVLRVLYVYRDSGTINVLCFRYFTCTVLRVLYVYRNSGTINVLYFR